MTTGTVIVEMHEASADHRTGRWHPESPDRLVAVNAGIERARLGDALVRIVPGPASRTDLERVHRPAYLDAIEAFCAAGGGEIDADTVVVQESWRAALLGAGAGLDAAARLRRGEGDAAFIAVRPPGHHATPTRAMGFCVINNVAVAAAALADAGERVLIVDIDAHHGNGTQDAFYGDGRVTYLSLHQWPFYPGTGRLDEIGVGAGAGATVNLPMPAGATGDVYLGAFDEVIVPVAERVKPTWVIISAGFDGHRADPLTDMGLSSGDYADLVTRIAGLAPAGRRLVVLEGGYDLEALAECTVACLTSLAGDAHYPEPVTNGGPGRGVVDAARALHIDGNGRSQAHQ
ncbi:MAG: histone deacetylase [Actinomycetota bacterium]|nr:histone deacetylase [Actinomycetota bacterium]